MIKTVFAYIAAPITGSIIGGFLMSLVVPTPSAFFCLMFTLIGAGVAIAATAVFGWMSLYVIKRFNLSLKPSFLLMAIIVSLIALALVQYATNSRGIPPIQTIIFAFTTAIATALIFLGINPQEGHKCGKK
jgi:hypothetical protein